MRELRSMRNRYETTTTSHSGSVFDVERGVSSPTYSSNHHSSSSSSFKRSTKQPHTNQSSNSLIDQFFILVIHPLLNFPQGLPPSLSHSPSKSLFLLISIYHYILFGILFLFFGREIFHFCLHFSPPSSEHIFHLLCHPLPS